LWGEHHREKGGLRRAEHELTSPPGVTPRTGMRDPSAGNYGTKQGLVGIQIVLESKLTSNAILAIRPHETVVNAGSRGTESSGEKLKRGSQRLFNAAVTCRVRWK
jgi:hypothetical protein